MANRTTSHKDPERLSQRWALILIAAFMVGTIFFVLAGPLAALGAAGGAVLGLHQILA